MASQRFSVDINKRSHRATQPWRLLAAALCCLVIGVGPFRQAQSSADTPAATVITNCTNDSQLRSAASAPGVDTITFNCGEAIIPITAAITVQGSITINGGGVISLDGGNTSSFFQVFSTAELTLRNMTLLRGRFDGVHPLENFGKLTLQGVRMQSNTSDGAGGALVNYGTLLVTSSSFINNQGNGSSGTSTHGGAILNSGVSATIANSVFTNNKLTGSFGLGGAIANELGALSVTRTSFQRNNALDGGAIFIASSTVATVTLSTFTSNTAGYGGAIESNGELQVDYSTFTSNSALNDGGAIWVLNSDTDVTYSTFAKNSSGTTGGAISCYANTLSVIHSTLNNNRAGTVNNNSHGGAIYSTCNLNLTNSTLSGNRAPNGGGGGIYQGGSGFANVVMVSLVNNRALYGAAVYNDNGGSALQLQQSMLVTNQLIDGTKISCDGVITSLGYNVSDYNCGALTQTGDKQSAKLPIGALDANGGATATHQLRAGNEAINRIPSADCSFLEDQRNISRPLQGKCDSGSLERDPGIFIPLLRK